MRVDLQGGSVEFKARESVLSKIEASLQPGFEPVQPKYAATVMLCLLYTSPSPRD